MSEINEVAVMPRYAEALQFCFEIHQKQYRKGDSKIPYLSHLLAVSALVMEQGGNEDEAIGALLHDSAEDCGGRPMLEKVRSKFGDAVAGIVEGCSDNLSEDAEAWRPRKERYIEHLKIADKSTLLVAACDKFHNLSNTVRDLLTYGNSQWGKFNKGPDEQVWYFDQCCSVFEAAGLPIAAHMRRELAILRKLAE